MDWLHSTEYYAEIIYTYSLYMLYVVVVVANVPMWMTNLMVDSMYFQPPHTFLPCHKPVKERTINKTCVHMYNRTVAMVMGI